MNHNKESKYKFFLDNFFGEEKASKIINEVEEQLIEKVIRCIMNELTSTEGAVLGLRYGLDDGKPKSLEEVGKMFNVTRERIRQIEAKALRKLRHPRRMIGHLGDIDWHQIQIGYCQKCGNMIFITPQEDEQLCYSCQLEKEKSNEETVLQDDGLVSLEGLFDEGFFDD